MMATVTGGASVTSKRPSRMLTELRATSSYGNLTTLEDGRDYVDWQAGLHGALFSPCARWWVEAIQIAAAQGGATSIACKDERIVAGMLGQFYPDIESVRWMINGSDGCAAAAKLARAVTHRSQILVYGYHGTSSAYAAPPESSNRPNHPSIRKDLGTLQAERDAYLPLEWLGDLIYVWSGIAAVIVECPPVDGGREEAGAWLRHLADEAHAHGALFILDEVVTGFRYGPGGAAGYYDLHGLVDLYCFGKTLGNGYPVAALGGSEDLMRWLVGIYRSGMVHMSGTFYGEPIGMAVAKAMLQHLLDEPPWDHLYYIGRQLKEQWNKTGIEWQMDGHPTRPIIYPEPEDTARFDDLRRHLFRRGHIFCSHPIYVSTETTMEDIKSLCEGVESWMTYQL